MWLLGAPAARAPSRFLLRLADLEVNLIKREAKRGGTVIHLRPREFRMLEVLLKNRGKGRLSRVPCFSIKYGGWILIREHPSFKLI